MATSELIESAARTARERAAREAEYTRWMRLDARLTVCHHALNAEEARRLLDMLGLADPNDDPRTCGVCGHCAWPIPLRRTGTVSGHHGPRGGICKGTGHKPACGVIA